MRKVHIGTSFARAELIRSLLRMNGIESFLENEGAMSVSGVPLPAAPLGVLVEDQHAERAMQLIDEELKAPLEAVKTELTFRSACSCGKFLEFPKTEDPPEECPWCGRPVPTGVTKDPQPEPQAVKPGRAPLWGVLVIGIVGALLLFWIRGGNGDDGCSADTSHVEMSRRLRSRIAAIPSVEVPPIDPEPIIATLATEYPEEAALFKAALEKAETLENLILRWNGLTRELAPDWAVDSGFEDHPRLGRTSIRSRKAVVLLNGLVLQKFRTLATPPSLLDGQLLERQLERVLLEYTISGAGLRDPRSAFWGVLATRHLKGHPSIVAERLEQVPDVVGGVRKELLPTSLVLIEAGLQELNNAMAVLWELEQDPAGERVQAAVGKAREALFEFREYLESLQAAPQRPLPQDPRWISFLLRNGEFTGRTLRESAGLLLEESERARSVWSSSNGNPDPGTSSYSVDAWRGVIQELITRARDRTLERGFAEIPPGENPEVRTSRFPEQQALEWPLYDARAFETPFHASLLVPSWKDAREGSQALAFFGVLGMTFPGCHLQMLVSRRDGTLLRRLYSSSSLPEGWQEYCRRWAIEDESADSPARRTLAGVRYGQGWRGAVEICFLAGTLTEHEALEMLQAGLGQSRESARSSLRWAVIEPLYGAMGLLGGHDILQLRSELQTKLGDRFDLKRFHTRLMGYGRTPVALLRGDFLRDLK